MNIKNITIITPLSYSAFNSAFVANVENFVFKSEFFIQLEILDSSTNYFSFVFLSCILSVNLL